MHKDIDSKYIICTEMVSRNRNDIQSSLDSLFKWESDLKSLKQHTSEIYLFKVVKFLDAKTYQKELEIREIQTATVPILTYHPSESESNITKLIQDLGRIAIENVQIQMPLLDIDQQGQFLVWDERKLSLKHSFPSTKLRNKVRINKGCFIPGDRLLLCQDLGKQLFVCALDGSNTNIIYLDHKAQNITLNNKNHAVVSVGDAGIQIIDLTSLKPGKIIPVDGCCFGIACVKDKIWVNNRKCTLTIMDINGKILQKIKTTFDPQEICANQDGDIYCTDNNSEKLYVVTSDGIEREIYNSPDLICTVGVAVDDRGDVYVAGCSADNIHRISNDGQKHDIVLTAQDGINGPSGLSYNTDTRELLVFNDFKKSVNVFQTQ
ncbi:uncharacterized protein [Mytilus edulis]|uniref:uncharacterized protein n=1 Tax=Mytilus edulis TaxID=6550 RepID=UPI0039F1206D